MQLLDGKLVSMKIKDKIKEEVNLLKDKPRLAVIKVGKDSASEIYVKNKIKNCEYTGIESITIDLDINTSEVKLLEVIKSLNDDKTVNGILVQLPLPKHINKDDIINAIDVNKDVDCFHPYNIGKLYSKEFIFKPCTPWGVIELLKYYNISISGKHCVIIGRSDIVGKPMAQLLLNEDATVTICHSKTFNIENITKSADIIISAIGKPKFLTKKYFLQQNEYFKNIIIKEFGMKKYEENRKKQTVIDIGINRDENGKLCGDVDFEDIKDIVDYLTPVPGGVGVLTTTMLMQNTLTAYKIQNFK